MTLALNRQLSNADDSAAPTREDAAAPCSSNSPGADGAPDLLQGVRRSDIELQPPCPCHESLEWQLSQLYWREQGLLPFVQNTIPYVINNSGRLSEHAAVLLFENLSEHEPPPGEIVVLELGAGTGLFAKLFLDAFRDICQEQGRDYYERLRYVVSDHSPRTLEHWRERGLFEEHAEQALLAEVDALQPSVARTSSGVRSLAGVRAVFCNYVLDVLPATIWRRHAGRIEELLLSTHLSAEDALRGFTSLTLDEVRACASGPQPSQLLPLLPQLEVEVRFAPPRKLERWGAAAEALLEELGDGARLAINFGAFDALQSCLGCLASHGFLLLNDYGAVGSASTLGCGGPQRFGSTLALGLTFPLLERCMADLGFCIVAPSGDDERQVHTRLLSHVPLERTQAALVRRFSVEVERALDADVVAARQHAAAGRTGDALDAYRVALERVPKDWHLLGEIAEYVGPTVRDFEAGCAIAQRALDLNPWTSSWLWNVLGDCYYYQGRYADAHQAFSCAQRLDPNDVRTNLNLGHSFASFARYPEALVALAHGLSHDSGAYRSLLLQQQEQVLAALAQRHTALQEGLVRRAERFGAA